MSLQHNLTSILSHTMIETNTVLKAAAKAHKELGELKGVAASMPNQYILIGTLSLQEAKESSEIENIITTHDALYQSNYRTKHFISHSAKEVHSYAEALKEGYQLTKQIGLLTNNTLKQIQETLEGNNAGFRKQAGTELKNDKTNEIIYTPPQDPNDIITLMNELEIFINDGSRSELDDLIKMALIHHQFESIHPFYDGNGRTGRILNILYLVKQDLLGAPILYLSRYINQNKSKYYQLLQSTRDTNEWEPWVLFMLDAITQTAKQTIQLINQIKELMQQYKGRIKDKAPKIYSHELLNNLFKHPYTKIEFLENDLNLSRQTCAKYLNQLEKLNLIKKHKLGKENFYINTALFNTLQNIPAFDAN